MDKRLEQLHHAALSMGAIEMSLRISKALGPKVWAEADIKGILDTYLKEIKDTPSDLPASNSSQ